MNYSQTDRVRVFYGCGEVENLVHTQVTTNWPCLRRTTVACIAYIQCRHLRVKKESSPAIAHTLTGFA